MVDYVMKPVKPEVSVTTATTLNNTKYFRAFAAAQAKVTIRAAGVEVGSMTMPAGMVEILEKNADETIESTSALLCTPLAYR